jgi:beta-mannosidase
VTLATVNLATVNLVTVTTGTMLRLAILALLLPPFDLAASPQKQVVPLGDGWVFRQSSPGEAAAPPAWHPAQVPGDVHLDLLRNGTIPDPFYRDNEAKLQWVEQAGWEYRQIFRATPATLAYAHVEVVFEGLDSACEVLVNGIPVIHADNAFLAWRAELRPLLHQGDNEILVRFPPPLASAAVRAGQDPWRERTHTEEKTYIRKPAYEFGWDWGPRFVTSGIWRPVHLELWNSARIADTYVHQRDVSAEVAHVDVEVEIESSEEGAGQLTVSWGAGQPASLVKRPVLLRAGRNTLDVPVEIPRPKLWWPAGYGEPSLYSFDVELARAGSVMDRAGVHAGLRSVVLRRERDPWGRSFEFLINGVPFYAKGADLIPFDSFPSRVTAERYRQALESAREANMNMVRAWGGGYYETDEFYDLCDRLGIAVWQDFMFGNDWQPSTYDFQAGVEREAVYQLRRLRNHPSIVLWAGNNETESAFHWKGRDQLPDDVRLHMWQGYLTLFSGVIARTVARLDPETPYWPSSPSSDYEETSPRFESGDTHDWTVWHGRADFAAYESHFPRFMTEFGFQSFPELRTVEAFTLSADRAGIFTDVMQAHQKNSAGNSIIDDYMRRYYGEPRDFPTFLYASQVLQAEAVKVGAEHLRRLRPRNMGSIYWQLNDCWPVASWSSIDYFGRWKALQYYARRFYAPLLVSPHLEEGEVSVYVVSDRTRPVTAQLRLRVMDFRGRILRQQEAPVEIPPQSSRSYVQVPLEEILQGSDADAAALVVAAELAADGRPLSSNLLYLAPTRNIHLPRAAVTTELSGSGGNYHLRLSSPVLARSVYVSFGGNEARLSDNYVDLLPGESLDLAITSSATLEELRSSLKTISLADVAPAER